MLPRLGGVKDCPAPAAPRHVLARCRYTKTDRSPAVGALLAVAPVVLALANLVRA